MSEQRPLNILCIGSYLKGIDFMRACKQEGCNVYLVMSERLINEPWPWESITEHFQIPDLTKQPDITHAISYLARARNFDALVPLDEYDIGIAASLREHLRLPGMGETTARHFRDKLAMRVKARDAGLAVPDFVHILNYDQLREYMARVPAPWLLKPRSEAASVGIKKVHDSEDLWRTLDMLGDKQSYYVLESYVPGEVFHVDSLVADREVKFSVAHKYGQPPLNIAQGGGVFITRTMPHEHAETKAMLDFNTQVIKALGMVRGATHAEFIQGEDGKLYFLEIAARVGGVNIDKLVEAATGINLWAEWARIEIAHLRGLPYQLPPVRKEYGGLMICLAKQEYPDLSPYQDPEIVWRMEGKKHHASLIMASPSIDRVSELLTEYSYRFANDFLAVEPPMDTPPE